MAFIAPGFIWTKFEYWLAPRFKESDRERSIKYFSYSVICLAFSFPLVRSLPQSADSWEIVHSVLAVISFLLIPAFLGALVGFIKKNHNFKLLLGKYGLPQIYAPDTGWDSAFDRVQGCSVAVEKLDGSVIYGMYDTRSVASTDPECRDVFLDVVYSINQDDKLVIDKGSLGIWISGKQIRTIQLFNPTEDE